MTDRHRERSPHRRTVVALEVIATILTFVAIFSFWISRQALNTDNWVNTSSRLLENRAIQEQLSTFLVNQLYANVDVQAELEKKLPEQAKALAGPAAGGLRQLATQVSERALASPAFQTVWETANRAAHEQLLKVINGGGNVVSTEEGVVTLKLGTLVKDVGEQVGLPSSLTEKLPPEAGTFTVLKSKQLSTVQKIARAIRRLPLVLTALVILLFAAAIYLAQGRRREAVRAVGIGFLVAGVLVLVLRRIAGNNIVDSLVNTASLKPAAEAAWSIGTSLLFTIAVSAVAFGIIVIVGAWLAGRTAPAVALRREAAPYVRENQLGAYGVAAAIWLALILWAPIAAFGKPFGILLFAVLFAIGTEALRRQTLREFPHGEPGKVGDRIRERLRRRPASGEAAPPAQPVAAAPASQLEQLERLAALRRENVLTDEEFAAQKEEILNRRSQPSR